jgi:hypothetical protein
MRAFLRFVILSGLTVCLAAASGCSDSVTPPDSNVTFCTDDEDCPSGEYCQGGVCSPATIVCEDGGVCPSGMTCEDGVCVPENDGGDSDGDAGDGDNGGDQPDIDVLEPGLSEGIHQLNFGNVLVGVTVVKQIRIENAGNADLRILQLNFEMGTDIEDFAVPRATLDSLPVAVGPGQEFVFDVTYTASDGRTDHGVLDVISNDPDEALVQIHLLSEFKGEARVEVAPRALPFGDVAVGSASQPLSFTITNQGTGNAVLSVDAVRLEVIGNPNFSLSMTDSDGAAVSPPALLNNGDFLDVAVVFTPQTNGSHTDNVAILTDDSINPAVMVAASGRGVVGDLTINPSPIAFGRVRVGTLAGSTVTITNGGGADLSLSGVYLETGSVEWTLTSNDLDLIDLPANPYLLRPGASVQVLLEFEPIAPGARADNLVIDNSSADPQRLVAVSAQAYIPAAVETVPAPPELSFGNVQMDMGQGFSEQASLFVTIRNVGGEPLQITGMQRTGGIDFTYQPPSIPPIDMGVEVPLQVNFEPSLLGPQSASILVDTNDPDISLDGVVGRFRIDAQANGIDPNIFIAPTSKDFGNVYVGQTVSQQFSIRNAGTGPLQLSTIQLTAGSSNSLRLVNLPGLPVSITNPMMEVTFLVEYQPDSLGEDLGAVLVTNSDIGNPSVTLNLRGVGAGCPGNQIDCNGNPQDGCERTCVPSGGELCNSVDDDCDCLTDEDFDLLNDPNHCGTCPTVCSYPNAQPTCVNGVCGLLTCLAGWSDCNASPSDGCEINTNSSVANCGSCGNVCSFANAGASCLGGTCVMGACNAGWSNCNGSEVDGCEVNTQSDVNNCNSCGNRCQYANANASCLGGTCVMSSCLAGFRDCNFDPSDGCEVNIRTDPNNCNGCNIICPPAGGTPVCNNGTCGVSGCLPGRADCDANPADCETDIANDPANCGGCGLVCNLAHATEGCVNQTCTVTGCDPGWGNCNSQNPDGCETNTTNTTAHCGFCGNACSFPNAGASCVGSSCVLGTCDPNFYNIDGNPLNGCECAGDNISNLCDDATISDQGVLANGAVLELRANLVPDDLGANRDVDWYTFTAPDNNSVDQANGFDNYHIKIEFAPGDGNPNNQFAFDIYRSTNTGAGCAAKGSPVCTADVIYEYLTHPFASTACVAAPTGTPGERVCLNGSSRYWVRVFRSGALVNCADYKINVTFTQ